MEISGQALAFPRDWRVAKNTLLSLGTSVHRDRLNGVEPEAVRLEQSEKGTTLRCAEHLALTAAQLQQEAII